MLAITRERLVEHLQAATALVDQSLRHDPDYPRRVVEWMADVEETLAQLRNPLASMVAAERARISAVEDGFREPEILRERISPRKAARATASLALGRAEAALRGEIQTIDEKFEGMRERMAQLLAVATNSHPIPLPPTDPRQAWLNTVWAGFGGNGETASLYTYLNAALAPVDRSYLLNEMLTNLLSAQATPISGLGFVAGPDVAKLSAAGIDTAQELLAVGSTRSGRRGIEQATGHDADTVRGWIKRIDLMRLEGVTAQYAALLVEAGVDSVRELRLRNPESLVRMLDATNAERKVVPSVPDLATVQSWVEEAGER